MAKPFHTILTETRGRVRPVTLNRPEALNRPVARELVHAAQEADADPAVGAAVITGSRKAFAAGADIKEMQAQDFAAMHQLDWCAEWDQFALLRKPLAQASCGCSGRLADAWR